jgi:hypothetical protein
VFPRGGGGETQSHKTEAIPAKIGEVNVAGVTPGHFSNLSDITTMIKRE